MEFLQATLFYGVKFIALILVAVAGVCVGGFIRKKKDAKKDVVLVPSENHQEEL